MKTAILGLSAYYHDSAAVLLIDGDIVAAAHEERFSRKKHDARFPAHAAQYVLAEGGVGITDLTAISFYDKPYLKFERLLETYHAFAPRGLRSFLHAMPVWMKEKLFMRRMLWEELAAVQGAAAGHGTPGEALQEIEVDAVLPRASRPPLLFPEHHLSHAASAFYPSPFREAAILTMDGVGEWATTTIGHGGFAAAPGDGAAASVNANAKADASADANSIRIIKELHFPHSIGLLYSAFTYYCGFRVNSGEYKLMGLAPYGDSEDEQTRRFHDLILEELVDLRDDGSLLLNMKYFDFATGLRMCADSKWERLFGIPRRESETDITQPHMNLALAIQQVTEEIVMRLARTTRELTGSRNLVMAGGVALNCVANGKLLREGIFDDIWIQPAAGDAGGALGAAYAAYHLWARKGPGGAGNDVSTAPVDPTHGPATTGPDDGDTEAEAHLPGAAGARHGAAATRHGAAATRHGAAATRHGAAAPGDLMKGSLLGPSFDDADITRVARKYDAPSRRFDEFDDLCGHVAELLDNGSVVGWFQGRMEWGPRALGNRSILGDPRRADTQKTLNLKIKYREGFRPFAPSVLAEESANYFEMEAASPYMLLVAPVVASRRQPLPDDARGLKMLDRLYHPRSDVPAITHVDYSARIQTVHRDTNPRYWGLINAFKERTGCGLVVNTSFNVRGEPIVCTPEDAYRCFMRTEMDYVVLGDWLFIKTEQPAWDEPDDWAQEFTLD